MFERLHGTVAAPTHVSKARHGAPRFVATTLVCLLAVVMLGAGDPGARFGRIGHNLMCVCSCNQVLLECNHVGCPDSERMRGELTSLVANTPSGPDSAVLNWFTSKYGAVVLAAPIRGGFDNLAWILPAAIFVLAIFGTAFLVRLWGQRRRLAPVAAVATPPIDDRLRDRIRRETQEWL